MKPWKHPEYYQVGNTNRSSSLQDAIELLNYIEKKKAKEQAKKPEDKKKDDKKDEIKIGEGTWVFNPNPAKPKTFTRWECIGMLFLFGVPLTLLEWALLHFMVNSILK